MMLYAKHRCGATMVRQPGNLVLDALKQHWCCRSSEVETYQLMPQPMTVQYDEFEALMVAMALHMYAMQKRTEPLEEFLGETVDGIFRASGILVDLARDA